jgi:hypothetical protein
LPLDDYLDAVVAGRMNIQDVLHQAMALAAKGRR